MSDWPAPGPSRPDSREDGRAMPCRWKRLPILRAENDVVMEAEIGRRHGPAFGLATPPGCNSLLFVIIPMPVVIAPLSHRLIRSEPSGFPNLCIPKGCQPLAPAIEAVRPTSWDLRTSSPSQKRKSRPLRQTPGARRLGHSLKISPSEKSSIPPEFKSKNSYKIRLLTSPCQFF